MIEFTDGALQFESTGAGTNEYTGGFLDYELTVDDSSKTLSGSFFFKPRRESGSGTLSPNGGNAETFSLWGNNWMHDTGGFAGVYSGWEELLDSLGYNGAADPFDQVQRLEITEAERLGIDLHVTNRTIVPPPDPSQNVPESSAIMVWAVLIASGAAGQRRVSARS